MADQKNPLVVGIFGAIVAIIIGAALASTPSPLQPAGYIILIFGILLFLVFIYGIYKRVFED